MQAQATKLWALVLDRQELDPVELAAAIEEQAAAELLDFRTRLLIRDSVDALENYWGRRGVAAWLSERPVGRRIEAIRKEALGNRGFPSLAGRIMETTKPEAIQQFFRELGVQLHQPVRVSVGGSAALIIPGYLARRTEDIDVVDEVPSELRSQHRLLDQLRQRYHLQLAHFQSHYLPSGWECRVHSLESFGRLQVFLVDVYDVFLSKLFSIREKDRDDLRVLAPQLDRETLIRRLQGTTAGLLAAEGFRQQAENNWYIIFGQSLPSQTPRTGD
jgi:hypothetical protein